MGVVYAPQAPGAAPLCCTRYCTVAPASALVGALRPALLVTPSLLRAPLSFNNAALGATGADVSTSKPASAAKAEWVSTAARPRLASLMKPPRSSTALASTDTPSLSFMPAGTTH